MNSGETALALAGPLPQWLNFLAMFIAVLLAAVGVLFWAVALRRKPRRRKRRHHRKHHEQRRPNPTLAETGGLPPVHQPENPSRPDPTP